jgi:hypothetical protein
MLVAWRSRETRRGRSAWWCGVGVAGGFLHVAEWHAGVERGDTTAALLVLSLASRLSSNQRCR